MSHELKSTTASSSVCERIQVEFDTATEGKRVKIRLESHDANLGWYSCGSLTLPIQQLPLLEQAIADLRSARQSESEECKIIPFPG